MIVSQFIGADEIIQVTDEMLRKIEWNIFWQTNKH